LPPLSVSRQVLRSAQSEFRQRRLRVQDGAERKGKSRPEAEVSKVFAKGGDFALCPVEETAR
jgi:hypothetical protein